MHMEATCICFSTMYLLFTFLLRSDSYINYHVQLSQQKSIGMLPSRAEGLWLVMQDVNGHLLLHVVNAGTSPQAYFCPVSFERML
jgi:hypothetical protein